MLAWGAGIRGHHGVFGSVADTDVRWPSLTHGGFSDNLRWVTGRRRRRFGIAWVTIDVMVSTTSSNGMISSMSIPCTCSCAG